VPTFPGDPDAVVRQLVSGGADLRENGRPVVTANPAAGGDRERLAEPLAPARVVLEFDVPVLPRAEPNVGGSLRAKLARKAEVKRAVADALGQFLLVGTVLRLPRPAAVTLTRYGRRQLDSDNLAGSLKVVRDTVALLVYDSSTDSEAAGFTWACRQERTKGPGFVRVRCQTTVPEEAA
jgi:hypothetical protein